MYKILHVEQDETRIFDAPIYHMDFLILVENEVTRLNGIKQAKLAALTLELKANIKSLWAECLHGDDEKKEFALFNEPSSNTDECYNKLTQYANVLNDLYERNRSIFETTESWKKTWMENIDFEIKYSDHNRFEQKDFRSFYESTQGKKLIEILWSLIETLNGVIGAQDNDMARQQAVKRCLSFI